VVFYQTKPEDGGWREYLNCTRLPREPITKPNLKMEDGGNIWTYKIEMQPNQTWRWGMAAIFELYNYCHVVFY
jgi:hypothetical protein